MYHVLTAFLLVVFLAQISNVHAAEREAQSLASRRLREISKMLREDARTPGWPITDREAWERLGRDPEYAAMPAAAEKLLRTPLPEQPDELYLEFSRTGNRVNWQRVADMRRSRLTTYVLAECVENKGRFLPALEGLITGICAERTWVLPAHDSSLINFHGTGLTIDLCSSAVGWNLAMTDWLIGSKLRPEVLEELRSKVRSRVVDPYLESVRGKRKPEMWMKAPHNWNPVCTAGVTGAGLIELNSPDERAELIAAAEVATRHYLSGFTRDGYCGEGTGYWSYGFGHLACLSEIVGHATRGGIDLLALPEARMPARFGGRIEMANGMYPAFADCNYNQKPAGSLMWLLNRRLGLGNDRYRELSDLANLGASRTGGGYLAGAMICAQASLEKPYESTNNRITDTIRSWFDHAGILVCRPLPNSKSNMAVALKGGHNAEPHNHNDLGSFVVLCGNQLMLLDPGTEVYTARTFGKHRYESKLLNSYGHSVPVVGGKLQRTGADAGARVLGTSFSDKSDVLRLDLTSAYDCPELTQLKRTFAYSRIGAGQLRVTDEVEFAAPQSFGTALVTTGSVAQVDERTLVITSGDEKLTVEIACGLPFTVRTELIEENSPVKPTRIGIELRQPVTSAFITVRLAHEDATQPTPAPNTP